MTPNEYQKEALRTDPTAGYSSFYSFPDAAALGSRIGNWRNARLLNGLMGLSGESGEALDLLKKHIFQGHELDRTHLEKELGDVAWYLALSADALGFTLEEILQVNVDKLRERYPQGFDTKKSTHRAADDV